MNNFIINKEYSFQNLLSYEHYFQSLLQALYTHNLLNMKEVQRVQFQLLEILTETIGYYTKNKSSSVRVEIAEQIMLSIYYTIGQFLKKQPAIKESIDLIKNEDIKHLFIQGEKILKAKTDECIRLLEIVKETRLQTENYAYVDTIDYGIPLFFKEYDIRFASHETPGSIDYPLAIDVIDLTGVEYIEEYLNKVILENKFCSYFDGKEIEALIKGFNKNSNHMLINIFQLVMTNYLGRVLMRSEGRSLEITKGDRAYLKSTMENLPKLEYERLICTSAEKICKELSIEDKNLIEYVNKTVFKIIPEIKRKIEADTLESVFTTLNKSDKNVFKYEDGESLDDKSFRNIVEEIRNCSRVKDKIEIIREEVHSLKDLMDILSSDCIFDDEFIHVFKALDDFEIALLIKSISNDETWDNDYGTESEKEWQKKLKIYIDGVSEIKKGEILSLSQEIDI